MNKKYLCTIGIEHGCDHKIYKEDGEFYCEYSHSCQYKLLDENENNIGVKNDKGKLRYDLIPGDVLREIAAVFTYGATEYGDRNWENGIEYGRLFAASQRHTWDWMSRIRTQDEKSHLHNLAHAIVNLMMLLHYELHSLRYEKYDDRPGKTERANVSTKC